MRRKYYVCGFMFSEDKHQVILIRKNRPKWQEGKYNGVGGKIKPNEAMRTAMVREFHEEAGIETIDWRLFCALDGTYSNGIHWTVNFFITIGDLSQIEQKTDEELWNVSVDKLKEIDVVNNLHWLIPMALSKDNLHANVAEQLRLGQGIVDE